MPNPIKAADHPDMDVLLLPPSALSLPPPALQLTGNETIFSFLERAEQPDTPGASAMALTEADILHLRKMMGAAADAQAQAEAQEAAPSASADFAQEAPSAALSEWPDASASPVLIGVHPGYFGSMG